jgi:alkyl hydroperoxide reductase subunit AhpC
MYSLKAYAEKENYKFSLLSDFWPHGDVAKKYDVFNAERGCATRGTFIIDKTGVLRWSVTNSIGDARNLVDYKEALAAL